MSEQLDVQKFEWTNEQKTLMEFCIPVFEQPRTLLM